MRRVKGLEVGLTGVIDGILSVKQGLLSTVWESFLSLLQSVRCPQLLSFR